MVRKDFGFSDRIPKPSFSPPGFTPGNDNPFDNWPEGEVYEDLKKVLNLVLRRFNVPHNWVVRLVGTGLNITNGHKVENTLKDISTHDLVTKYRELAEEEGHAPEPGEE